MYFIGIIGIALICFTQILHCHKESSKWICNIKHHCVNDNAELLAKRLPRFESQNDCRLSCGNYGAIWPQPTGECALSHERIHFDPNTIEFAIDAPSRKTIEFLTEAKNIFAQNILKEVMTNGSLDDSQKIVVNISVKSPNLSLNWKTDESYSLIIISSEEPTVVLINAETVFGSRHALETLSNLMTGSQVSGLIMVRNAQIVDEPKYPHRGLLIDTSRNFIPVENIKRSLDAMAVSKLNVFHWHITDSHSFPLEISRVPQLHSTGAYSVNEVYSKKDTRNIVQYAKYRGIRVIIEIDGPSHAGNGWQWGPSAGLGKLAVCINSNPWPKYCVQPPCGQLNPANEETYHVLKDIYTDIAEMIESEETLHMGGDEVHIPCWNATREIVKKMKDSGYDNSEESFLELWSIFHQQNYEIWNEINHQKAVSKPVILWSSRLTEPEIIEKYLPNDRFIIQTWVDSDSTLNGKLLDKGYRIIISTSNAWYLDHGFYGTNYHNWRNVYNNKLIKNKLVLGGEVCMWTEYVDRHSLEGRVWPRAGAASERLWSNPSTTSRLAEARFYRYRQRLIVRGVEPEAIAPEWCVLNEGQCY